MAIFEDSSFMFDESVFDSGTDTKKSNLTIKDVEERALNELGEKFKVERLLKGTETGERLHSLVSNGDKAQMYDKMLTIFQEDTSLKGVTLLKKASIRKEYIKSCIDLDDSITDGMGKKSIQDYSLLALLSALACNKIKNMFSEVVDKFKDDIDIKALARVVPKFLEKHKGDHAKDVLLDIANSEVGAIVKTVVPDVTGMVVNFYNKNQIPSSDKTYSDEVDTIFNVITGPISEESSWIEKVKDGKIGEDIRSAMTAKPNNSELTTTPPKITDAYKKAAMFSKKKETLFY